MKINQKQINYIIQIVLKNVQFLGETSLYKPNGYWHVNQSEWLQFLQVDSWM